MPVQKEQIYTNNLKDMAKSIIQREIKNLKETENWEQQITEFENNFLKTTKLFKNEGTHQ